MNECLLTQNKSFGFVFTVVLVGKADWYILQFFHIWSVCQISKSINGLIGNFDFSISASTTSLALALPSVLQNFVFALQILFWKNRIFMLFLVLGYLAWVWPWNMVSLCYKYLLLHLFTSYSFTIDVYCCSRIFESTCPLAFRKNSLKKPLKTK